MKKLAKFAALGAVLAASAPLAFADPINGGIGLGGADSFNASSVTFSTGTGIVEAETGSLTTYLYNIATLTSFNTGDAAGTQLLSVMDGSGDLLTFTISSLAQFTTGTDAMGNPDLLVSGSGVFAETGFSNTAGTFSLTSTANGATTFQLNGSSTAMTPEPNSLLLMGTGLVGAAGLLFSRRRNAADLA